MRLTTGKNESGSAIVLVISIMTALIVIVGVAAEYTLLIGRNVQRSNTLESAIAIADGCIDSNFVYWRAICRAKPTTVKTTADLSVIPMPTAAQFPNIPSFTATSNTYPSAGKQTVQQCKVIALDPEEQPLSGSTAPPPAVGRYVSSDPNKTTATYNYRATAYVTLPALRGSVVAKVQRIFQKRQESPWNYAIFYVDPLEIHPGPEFNITGWVHTNASLYTGHKTLHFLDKVSYVDQWYRGKNPGDPGFMPGDARAVGGSKQETPTLPSWLSDQAPDRDDSHEPIGLDPELFNPTDSNQNNDGYHELIEPPVAGTDPLASQRYYNQADVIVQIDASNSIKFYNSSGVQITSSSSGKNLELYNMFNGSITTNQSIQDNREQGSVRLATLDISQLIKSDKQHFKSDKFNGVVYIYDTSAAAGAKRGIRLKNGAFIPQDGLGLTVASLNPVYIQGDFNTGPIGSPPPSNSGIPADATTPQVAGYIRQPCSVVADAVNILSNAWNDANSTKDVSMRVANNTTVNTAIVSGNVPTGKGGVEGYSGGAENFPRFLEVWGSGHTFTYYGSMVELYQSQQATGKWGSDNVYDPPTRQWFFDPNFKINAPPGTLMVYTYTKGRWALVP